MWFKIYSKIRFIILQYKIHHKNLDPLLVIEVQIVDWYTSFASLLCKGSIGWGGMGFDGQKPCMINKRLEEEEEEEWLGKMVRHTAEELLIWLHHFAMQMMGTAAVSWQHKVQNPPGDGYREEIAPPNRSVDILSHQQCWEERQEGDVDAMLRMPHTCTAFGVVCGGDLPPWTAPVRW